VGPGRPTAAASSLGVPGERVNGYPIQPAKVQRPPLRDQTLARDRLLDWLGAKIHHRVILVLADAGYGKTTLLADFSRRTRLKTLWYRLDEDDRDWIAFLNHLVAAGREHDPGFAPRTAAILGDVAVGRPTRDAAIEVFLRELPLIADQGAVLILDDFHLVDDSPDVRLIARELVAKAPDRLSIVFVSRRQPTIPLARLRAAGEVAEIGTDELRFDATETARLFSETYGRELEPDVLADVTARTEGWAASLQLVQAALRDRSPAEIRRFVRGLSGADQELYDYLAEEVVGELPDDLQQFLMRTSILQMVTADLASVVTGLEAAEVLRLTQAAERLTLLTRPARATRGPQRYHPLVREFLEARLRSAEGSQHTADLHQLAAKAVASSDWRLAAYHFGQAGDGGAVVNIIASAIPTIMGSGQHSIAVEHVDKVPKETWPPGLGLLQSRMQMQRGDYATAIESSAAVLEAADAGSPEADYALLNLVTMHVNAGQSSIAIPLLRRLKETTSSEQLRLIADGLRLMVATRGDGSIDEVTRYLQGMADRQRGMHAHYFGVTMLNLAHICVIQDGPEPAVGYASEAIEALAETSSRIELSSALMAKASALAMLGRWTEARPAVEVATRLGQVEADLELAEMEDSYGDPGRAWTILDRYAGSSDLTLTDQYSLAIQSARHFARRQHHREAASLLAGIDLDVETAIIGHTTARLTTEAYLAAAAGLANAQDIAAKAQDFARRQAAHRWRRTADLIFAFAIPGNGFAEATIAVGDDSPWNVTFVADLVAIRLDEFDQPELDVVARAAKMHPGRWRFVLRDRVASSKPGSGLNAARLLEMVGDRTDVRRLRAYAGQQRKLAGAGSLGKQLSRQLAERVFVEDLGRVAIGIGDRHIPGSTIRRRVLALLCFLLTKPDLASTRDQVLDALWPDLDPVDAVNSLNQTVYFFRRVLEENYVDDLSPGYVHHDSDLIWLDRDLVTSRSNDCRQLIKSFPPTPTPEQVFELSMRYAGRFALDFEYEDWAAPYREWLHASFLEVVERAVSDDLETGHYERGIRLARRVLDIDPTAEQVEVSLLRLYRSSGAHAAAAEQYSHYAAVMRDQLGVEAPSLDSL
jgi:ATP/maltotriose-dependent transcriptional regulator MalT/DNA-binding SARP family transcriptional activator